MLRRLDEIRDAGIFSGFRWDRSVGEFARINVVYGPNGSGKTTLAQVFDSLRGSGASNASFTLESGATSYSSNFNDNPVFERVFAFSDAYVDRNHRFTGAEPDMSAVLTLGLRTAEADDELVDLRSEQETRRVARDAARTSRGAYQRDLDRVFEELSATVVSDLSRAGGRFRSRSVYSARTARRSFEGARPSWTELSDQELTRAKQVVNSDRGEPLPKHSHGLTPPESLAALSSAALRTVPLTTVLETLREHPDASRWVQDGLHLHESNDTCLFCGGELDDARKASIALHFSDAVDELQRDLRSLLSDLHQLVSDADSALASVPADGLLYEDLRERHTRAAAGFEEQGRQLKEWAEELAGRLQAKLGSVLSVVENAEVTEPVALDAIGLKAVEAEHDERHAAHAGAVVEAADQIEHHHLKRAESRVEELVAAIDSKGETERAADERLRIIQDRITVLEAVEGDPTPTAQVLTSEVNRLLGRDELTFTASGSRYAVTRFGRPATALSTAERTAIALVHFLESVARFDASKGKPIVVIDDPVSSLDSNIFMGVSTYIWSESVAKDHIEQVFLLTHNFELFRQWDIQCEGLRGEAYSNRLYEIKTKHRRSTDGPRRLALLAEWPPTPGVRKKIRSSYHHAFMALAEARVALRDEDSLEKRLDAQLLFPNVMRRVLETFMAFKRPDKAGDFNGSMRDAASLLRTAGYLGDADALRLRLTRYSHAYSHADTPTTEVTVSPEEIGAAIDAVMIFMQALDRDHFQGLCLVTGYREQDLAPVDATIDGGG